MSLPDGYPSDQDGTERYVWIFDGLDQRPETDTHEDQVPVVRLQVIDDRGRRGVVQVDEGSSHRIREKVPISEGPKDDHFMGQGASIGCGGDETTAAITG